MARNALTRIAAITTILIASSMLAGCAGSLESPERFGPVNGGGDAGANGGRDAGSDPVGDVDAGGTPGLTHTQVFESRCAGAGCHGATSPALGLDLVSAGLRDRTVDVQATGCSDWRLVVPGSAEDSFIYEKVAQNAPACGGARMPIGGGALNDEELAAIRTWIEGL